MEIEKKSTEIISYQNIPCEGTFIPIKKNLARSPLSSIVEKIIAIENLENPKILSLGSTPTALDYDMTRLSSLKFRKKKGYETDTWGNSLADEIKQLNMNISLRTRYTDTFFLPEYTCCDVDQRMYKRANYGKSTPIKGDFLEKDIQDKVMEALGGKPNITIAQNVLVTGNSGKDIGYYDIELNILNNNWTDSYRKNLADNLSNAVSDFLHEGSLLIISNFFMNSSGNLCNPDDDLGIPKIIYDNFEQTHNFPEQATKVFRKT